MTKITSILAFFILSLVAVQSSFQSSFAFTDVSGNSKYYEAISGLESSDIVDGNPDGTFEPAESINRAEFLKIIVEAQYNNIQGSGCFPDVPAKWFEKYICFAKSEGIVDGYDDNTFRPGDTISLAEGTKILLESLNMKVPPGQNTKWYTPYMQVAESMYLIGNLTNDPKKELTREEAAQLIYNSQEETMPSTPTPVEPPTPTETPTETPTSGLFDEEYTHLPPGKWDWNNADNDFANYRNFETNIGKFNPLKNNDGEQYGWELIGNNPDAIEFDGPAMYFYGSSGTDLINLGARGSIHSFGDGNLAGGDDVLVFEESYSLDFRTGSSLDNSDQDDDLVIGGCTPNTDTSFDIETTTIHTGPGSDTVFIRDMERAAIDAGNGSNGRTDSIDPNDGDDVVVFRGNMLDFRFFGGNGDDTAVWYVDEPNQDTTWLGPNFFGGGGDGDALWEDEGTDTLVLVIPTDTTITTTTPTQPGEVLVRTLAGYPTEPDIDAPVDHDSYARYCMTCGISPEGKKTITVEYNNKEGTVRTGYFWLTDMERLQIGVGSNAKVYELDSVNGTATLNTSLPKFTPPEVPEGYCK